MNTTNKITLAAAGFVSAAALTFGLAAGPMLASADTPSPSASASQNQQQNQNGKGNGPQDGTGQRQGRGNRMGDRDGRGPGGHEHTAATADQKVKVIAAVKAKDATITVTDVQVDPDKSFDARGTKNGKPIMVEVSADYKTVTVCDQAGQGRGPDGRRGPRGTEVTDAVKTKVVAAVKAKDSSVTIVHVRKMDDGTYHAGGTKGTTRVHYEVSGDFKTVTQR